MYYVYLIRSLANPEKIYIGYTTNLKDRLKKHNEAGSIAYSRALSQALKTFDMNDFPDILDYAA